MKFIRATSLGSYVSCPLKYCLDIGKVWDKNNALEIGKIVHLSRQSPTLATKQLDKMLYNNLIDAKEYTNTKKMIEVMAKVNDEVPDHYEVSFEIDLNYTTTLNNGEIELNFTWHPDEVWIDKHTNQIEKIVDTKTSGAPQMWKDLKMLDYARQHIYYPFLMSQQFKMWEEVEFVYRVMPKTFFSASDITYVKIKVNVAEAIRETEKDIQNFLESEVNNNYEPNENVQCLWCNHKQRCPKKSLISNL